MVRLARPRRRLSQDEWAAQQRMREEHQTRRQARVVAWCVVAVLLGAAAAAGVYGGVTLSYRTGHAGTAGTIGPIHCRQVQGFRRVDTVCTAVFTTSDGLSAVTGAYVENGDATSTDRSPARLHRDGHTVSIVGKATVAYGTALVTGGLLALELGVWLTTELIRRRLHPGRTPAWMWRLLSLVVTVTLLALLAIPIVATSP
jgi:hypothetical protein